MTQRKLETYFTIKMTHNTTQKRCFVYDAAESRAHFAHEPTADDAYVTEKLGFRLYRRACVRSTPRPLPRVETTASVPLLKSNLQKAVRRARTTDAINSAIALAQRDPRALMRRLPIIYVEDVCVMTHLPVVVWLMLAGDDHVLTDTDIRLLIDIVKDLCVCRKVYENELVCNKDMERTPPDVTPSDAFPVALQHNDCLLALHCRIRYGGMRGDMQLLRDALRYYKDHLDEIERPSGCPYDLDMHDCTLHILPAAVDFHVYPQILKVLAKKTGHAPEDIKAALWNAESRVNVRKPHTDMSAHTACYIAVSRVLPAVRQYLVGDVHM